MLNGMSEKIKPPFALRLKELREAAGLSQSQLAERAGLHLHGLTKLEQGDREPSWASVQALAQALDVKCDAFMQPPVARAAPGPGRPAKPARKPAAGKNPRKRKAKE